MDISSCASPADLIQKIESSSSSVVKSFVTDCLDSFIGANFTGFEGLPIQLPAFVTPEFANNELSFGLNTPFVKTRATPLLYICKVAVIDRLSVCEKSFQSLAFRILNIWQRVLVEPSSEVKKLLEDIISQIDLTEYNSDEKTKFYVECANLYLQYFNYESCQKSIDDALEVCGLTVDLVGKLGKRTRYQQKAVSQLMVHAKGTGSTTPVPDTDVPVNCAMNDDTLLEKVAFEVKEEVEYLNPLHLSLLLIMCQYEMKTQFHDDVLREKAGAFLETITSAQRCWAVQVSALLLRSNLEKKNKRKVERACSQAEILSKLMRGIDDQTEMSLRRNRNDMVLAAGLNPVWHAQVVQTEILRSLGCTSEALLILESLEMWDGVIECFKSLGQLEKAESLIRRLLEERPLDSMLYVYLGDITEEVSYYEKAIEGVIKISSDRNAKARKSLGMLHLIRKQYESAYEHLRRSLELQPIQLGVWFNAGYCAWKIEKYIEAATCYHRCVSLEPEHFEAWSNLSAAYIRQGQKERARRILQEALKFNYEHPNVWENYMLLCVDTGEFNAAIQSFHRLLDLNKRQDDNEVLEILANEVIRRDAQPDIPEEEKNSIKSIKDDLIKLFARITSTQTLSSNVWSLYARLKKPTDDNDTEFEKYIQLLERAVLSGSNKPDWFKTTITCVDTLNAATLLAKERLVYASRKGTEEAERQAKGRIRLALKPLITAAEKQHGDDAIEEVKQAISEAKEVLQKI